MEKNKALARLALIADTIRELPNELEPLSVYPESNRSGIPEVFVHENFYTCPDNFFTYADSIGATVSRVYGITKQSDELSFITQTGVKVSMFVQREEEHHDTDAD